MRALLVPLAAMLLLPSAFAWEGCVQDVEGEITVGVLHVWDEPCDRGCVVNLWVYEESNGIEGLQVDARWREGAACYPDMTPPDTLIL